MNRKPDKPGCGWLICAPPDKAMILLSSLGMPVATHMAAKQEQVDKAASVDAASSEKASRYNLFAVVCTTLVTIEQTESLPSAVYTR